MFGITLGFGGAFSNSIVGGWFCWGLFSCCAAVSVGGADACFKVTNCLVVCLLPCSGSKGLLFVCVCTPTGKVLGSEGGCILTPISPCHASSSEKGNLGHVLFHGEKDIIMTEYCNPPLPALPPPALAGAAH